METEKEYQNVNNNEDCIRLFIRCIENEKVDIQGMSVGSQARVLQTVLTHITKQDKMIDKMADEILELNTMIVEKGEFFSVVPMWLGKEHIIEYFKGITNKKD